MAESTMTRWSRIAVLLQHYVRTRYGTRWRSRAHFERWQARKIQQALEQIRAQSPFYRTWWADRPIHEWRQFPLVDKAVMMANFDDWNTRGIDRDKAMEMALEAERTRDFQAQIGDVTVGLSSGTSGHRGLFLISEKEQAAWAGTMLAKVLPNPLWHAEKIAFFLRANSNLYESVRGGRMQFRYYDLLDSLEQHVEQLNRYQPTLLVAPPSVLRMLASQKKTGQLRIEPHRLIAVAEVLDPLDEQAICTAFNQPVHQVYQCTEGFLACTCGHGRLHLNEDIVHIDKQYLDEGESGGGKERRFMPIVTDFSRMTQPIVRYRLNDVLTEGEACTCGSVFTVIKRIEGRADDVFEVPSLEDRQLRTVYPDTLTRAILLASDQIEEYRITQCTTHLWEIALQVTVPEALGEVQRRITEELASRMARIGCILPEIHFVPYVFDPSHMRKLRRVERRQASISDIAET